MSDRGFLRLSNQSSTDSRYDPYDKSYCRESSDECGNSRLINFSGKSSKILSMIDENCDFGECDSTFLGESKVIIDELDEDGLAKNVSASN